MTIHVYVAITTNTSPTKYKNTPPTPLACFIWILELVHLQLPQLLLPLSSHMLRKHFVTVLCFPLSNKLRIPQLTGNSQILTTSHQGVTLTALKRRSQFLFATKIILFSPCYRNQSSLANKCILTTNLFWGNERFSSGRQPPTAWAKRSI